MHIVKYNMYLELFGKGNPDKNNKPVTKKSLIDDITHYLSAMGVDPMPPYIDISYDKRLGYITISFSGEPYSFLYTSIQVWSDELIKTKASFNHIKREIGGKSTSPEEYMTTLKTEQELFEFTRANMSWILEEFIKDLDIYLKEIDIHNLKQSRKFRT